MCLSINDGALIALIAARLGAKHVYALELERMCNMMLKKYVQENNLQDKVTILDKKPDELSLVDLGGAKVSNHLVGSFIWMFIFVLRLGTPVDGVKRQ